MTFLGVLIFIVAILFSVGLHEFGHLITAKKFGIKAEQFFIGFGPKLWSFRRGETEYGVKALPLGGYVKIAGMNPFEDVAPEDRDRVFKAKKPWQRAIVLAAGSFTHFLLAFIILAGVLMIAGELHTVPTVNDVSSGSPAAAAGFMKGDRLVSIDGIPVTSWDGAVDLIHVRPGAQSVFVVQRNDALVTLRVRLADHKPDGTKSGYLGIGPTAVSVRRGPLPAFGRAGSSVGAGMVATVKAVRDLFSPSSISHLFRVAARKDERKQTDPSTLVGIGQQAGDLARSGDFRTIFLMIAALNIFIGVLNLLPLPPLDGGHLAVLAYEKVTRRVVDMRRLIPVAATVIGVFGGLFLLLLFNELFRARPIPG